MLADAKTNVATPRQRMSSGERRAAIVSAAVALFSQNGFRGTTTRELASAVGVSEPVLYQHFATKKDLYTAIVDQMLEEATEKFEGARVELCEEATDEQFFTRLGEMVLAWYLDDPRYIRLLMFSSLEGHELAQIWYEKATSQFIDYVMGEVRKRMEAGRFRELHPFLGAEAFVGMVAHFGMISAVHKCAFESVKREDVVKTFVDVYLNGIRRK